MQFAKKSLSVFLSVVLSVSLMGVPAYADEVKQASTDDAQVADQALQQVAELTQSAQENVVGEQSNESVLQEEANTGDDVYASAQAESLALAASSELVATPIKLNLADTVAYVYVDQAIIAAGEMQYIAVGFTDQSTQVQKANLVLSEASTGQLCVLESCAVTSGAVLFAFQTTQANIDGFTIQTMTWISDEAESFELDFSNDADASNTYQFDVVSPQLASSMQQASEIAEDQNTAVITIDEDGNLAACASVEEALQVSNPEGANSQISSTETAQSVSEQSAEDEQVQANEQTGEQTSKQTSESKSIFQNVLDAIVAFFSSIFVPQTAYADQASSREDYLIVAVDPGHGGSDSGASYNGLYESDVNLSIANALTAELQTYSGVSVIMTRTDDTYVGLQARVDTAAYYGADVLVSVHCNATGYGNAYGSEVWVPNSASYLYQETHVVGEQLGEQILSQLSTLGLYNRGVKTKDCTSGDTYADGSVMDYYTIISNSREAGFLGIIVEHAFIDNTSDVENYLSSEESREALGKADATGIANQYSIIKDSAAQAVSAVSVKAHVSDIGWESAVYDGKVAGTVGKTKSMEAFQVKLQNAVASFGGVKYRSANIDAGWDDWASDGETSGSTGASTKLEKIQIDLTGSAATNYDIYYRVQVANIGWLDWAKNGQTAGSSGYGNAIEAMEVVVVEKGSAAPGSTETPYDVNESDPEPEPTPASGEASIRYAAHVANIGWQSYVEDYEIAGTTGQSLQMEALKFDLSSSYSGDIKVAANVRNKGWQSYVGSGEVAGTQGQGLSLEGVRILLTEDLADYYDVYYRVYMHGLGWMDWACNGQSAGAVGFDLNLEAIQVVLVDKGSAAPGETTKPYIHKSSTTMLQYTAHVQNIGWQDYVIAPAQAGTTGQSLRVEALETKLVSPYSGDIQIATHVQNIGWQDYVGSGELAGTQGQALRLEAIKVKLTGEIAEHYDVYYRVHAQNVGWLDWAKNGESAGTAGYAYRLESIEIALVEKGGAAPGTTITPFIDANDTTEEPIVDNASLSYSAHVQNIGWQDYVDSPQSAGTEGQSLRVEALKAKISSKYSGDLQISTHVQNIGWQTYVASGELAGTEGEGLRLEAIRVRLTGDLAEHYDVYYRVHAQNFGWMGWAKNGESAGTAGFSYRLEAIQIVLVEKGGDAPGSTTAHFAESYIMGSTNTSVEQMVRRYNSVNVEYPSSTYAQYGAETIEQFCQILYEEAQAEGVNAEIVFVQAMVETGWLQFGGDVQADQCNFSGLGATGGGNPGESFNDWGTESVRKGLRAQVQHLKGYASTDDLNQECVDSRFKYLSSKRGCAKKLNELTGTWAMDERYAQKLEAQLIELMTS